MKHGYTHIVYVLDKSGSMDSLREEVIGGFNSFIRDQQNAPGEATLTLVQFANDYVINYSFKPVQEIGGLCYDPSGLTALYDAIGSAITKTGESLLSIEEENRPDKVLFIIMTDGYENSSCEYTRDKIFNMISHQKEKYSWEFVFAGANQDALSVGAGIGIGASNSLTYAANSIGTKSVYESLSANTITYRKGPSGQSFAFSATDRLNQTSAGA
jgi:hypothetical protein